MNKELFAERLKAKRKEKGYSNPNQFADAYNKKFPPKRKDDSGGNIGSGILGTIKHYENASYTKSMPSLDKVINMCDLLGCDIDYLAGRLDYETHNVEFISQYTGLSEEAVSFLHYLNTEENCIDQKRTISFLNRILSGDPKKLVPCETILTYMEMYVQSEKIVQESEEVLPIKTTKKETFNLNVPKLFRAYLLEDISNQLHSLFKQEEEK